jgi:hypothetical protein
MASYSLCGRFAAIALFAWDSFSLIAYHLTGGKPLRGKHHTTILVKEVFLRDRASPNLGSRNQTRLAASSGKCSPERRVT